MPKKVTGFVGFADGQKKSIRVPETFITDLLPQVDDLAELKLALHALFLLNTQESEMRYVRGDDLRADELLLASLNLDSDLRTPSAALEDALERNVARNTLIRVEVEIRTVTGHRIWEDIYFLNTAKGRQAAAMVRQGKVGGLRAVSPEEARMKVERPNLFVLYEQNIGMLTPLIADQLRDMERTYPPDWITEAFDISVASNKRALRYIQAILKRWETEGKDDGKEPERDSTESRRQKYIREEPDDIPFE